MIAGDFQLVFDGAALGGATGQASVGLRGLGSRGSQTDGAEQRQGGKQFHQSLLVGAGQQKLRQIVPWFY